MTGSIDHATLIDELDAVAEEMRQLERALAPQIEAAPPANRCSAVNLAHYVALRRRDQRVLQGRLAHLGLSSLGRAESHIMDAVSRVTRILRALAGDTRQAMPPATSPPIDMEAGHALLQRRSDALLGVTPADGRTRVMVTMPSEAASDFGLVCELLAQGMDCMRINCAHDDAGAWLRMIENLRRAEKSTGRRCTLLMDLAGPKLRTGMLEPGPSVVKIRPERDAFGSVRAHARIWLYAIEAPRHAPAAASASLGVTGSWLRRRRVGERLAFEDRRGARRELCVVDVNGDGCWVTLDRTAYFTPGLTLRGDGREAGGERNARIVEVPQREVSIRLEVGDTLILTADPALGRPATRDAFGHVLSPARISCTCPEIFADVRPGEEIHFDDGRISGIITGVDDGRMSIRIERTPAGGAKLRADKGINLPASELRLPALTAKDLEDLQFVAGHADMVALSFANAADDIADLQDRLRAFGERPPAVVIKVETRRGFRNLPALLLTALRSERCGVMIARGDLAVECGFERLAEVQEEILWMCEAAHVPVIWATQVLEGLAKSGLPSRAEITDAAMGNRAECVMLNKGPHIVEAVRALRGILRRMQDHQQKKRSMLRELAIAQGGFETIMGGAAAEPDATRIARPPTISAVAAS